MKASTNLFYTLLIIMHLFIACAKDECVNDPIEFECGIDQVNYEGKTYNTVEIGEQCWLKENLNIGRMIQNTPGSSLQFDNGIIEKYCYNNDEANCDIYGGLYEWDETMQYTTEEGVQGICPNGWHIPSLPEYQVLFQFVERNGNTLKLLGEGIGIGAGTNTSGFSALLAGNRYNYLGSFGLLGRTTHFWSSTKGSDSLSARNMFLDCISDSVSFHDDAKDYGFSVRCLRD